MKYDLKNKYKAQLADEYYNKLKEKGAYIELREVKLKRNLDQNGLYWLWLSCIQHETGYEKEQLHFLYRANYLQKPDEKIEKILQVELWHRIKRLISEFVYFEGLGDIINIISYSTTDLETDEFAGYMTKIKQHAKTFFNVTLLSLDEQNFTEFYREYYVNM